MRSAVKLRPVLGRLALCRNDPSLAPYEHLLWDRYQRYEGRFREIETNEGSLTAFADSYKTFGVHLDPDGAPGDVRYVEYAPGAARLCLTGDFNDWARWEHVGEVDEFGRWTVRVPASAGLRHGAHVRVVMETPDRRVIDRIPAWIRAVAPSPDEGATHHDGVYHDPPPGSGTRGRTRNPRRSLVRFASTRRTWACRPRNTVTGRTASSRTNTSSASPIWDTTRCSSWLSRITRITRVSGTR